MLALKTSRPFMVGFTFFANRNLIFYCVSSTQVNRALIYMAVVVSFFFFFFFFFFFKKMFITRCKIRV